MTFIHSKTLSEIIQTYENKNKQVSGELHEGVAQTLYSLSSGLQLLENTCKDVELGKYIKQMSHSVQRTIEDLRFLATDLHPPSLDVMGVFAALKAYASSFTNTYGIEVFLTEVGTEARLSNFTEKMIFRSCQEVLKVISAYADTEEVTIIFDWDKEQLVISFHIKGMDQFNQADVTKVEHWLQLIKGEVAGRAINGGELVVKLELSYLSEVTYIDQDSISG